MDDNIFTDDNHIASWVFYPESWHGNTEKCWTSGFTKEELRKLFTHMQVCWYCSQRELYARLRWIELRPRAIYTELISIKTAEISGERAKVISDLALPLIERIRQYLALIESEIQKLIKIVRSSNIQKSSRI